MWGFIKGNICKESTGHKFAAFNHILQEGLIVNIFTICNQSESDREKQHFYKPLYDQNMANIQKIFGTLCLRLFYGL
jgi:hypothetical protein